MPPPGPIESRSARHRSLCPNGHTGLCPRGGAHPLPHGHPPSPQASTSVLPPPEPPPEPIKAVTRLTIPQSRTRISTPSPMPRHSLLDGVTYTIPLEKGRLRPKMVDCFPQGSLSNPGILIRPASPNTPFEFPFPLAFNDPTPFLTDDLNTHRLPVDSVTRVVGLPRVFGLRGDEDSYACITARVNSAAAGSALGSTQSMVDGGANICVTGLLELVVDVEPIYFSRDKDSQVFPGLLLHEEGPPPTDSGRRLRLLPTMLLL